MSEPVGIGLSAKAIAILYRNSIAPVVRAVCAGRGGRQAGRRIRKRARGTPCAARRRSGASRSATGRRSEEHTSELQSLMRISYAVFCLEKNTKENKETQQH